MNTGNRVVVHGV